MKKKKQQGQQKKLLQFSDLRVDQRRELCIRVNIRELDRELSIRLSILYTLDY